MSGVAITALTLSSASIVSGGVQLTFSLPADLLADLTAKGGGGEMDYDLSCDGGTSLRYHGAVLAWASLTATTGKATMTCGKSPSTYRIYTYVPLTWTTPPSVWVTAK